MTESASRLLPVPRLELSDQTKERLRKVDTARPYVHRAILGGLPSLAVANHLLPDMKYRRAAIGALGAVGAGVGMLDRKIEELAEEHEELKPTLKNYAKSSTGGGMLPVNKMASVEDRVGRNEAQLSALFPTSMASRTPLRDQLAKMASVKEALMLDPRATAKGLGTAHKFMKGVGPTAALGVGGAAVGALSDSEDRIGGALKGGLLGAAAGGAMTGAAHLMDKQIGRGIHNIRGLSSQSGGHAVGDVLSAARAPNAKFDKRYDSLSARLRAKAPTPAGARPFAPAEEVATKGASIDVTRDAHGPVAGRSAYATLSLGGEKSNDQGTSQMLQVLFANVPAMRRATEEQLVAAFPTTGLLSSGRHRAIGRTAEEVNDELMLAFGTR